MISRRRFLATSATGALLSSDAGGAEAGFGLTYAAPAQDLTLEGWVRGLLTHTDSGDEEWDASGILRIDRCFSPNLGRHETAQPVQSHQHSGFLAAAISLSLLKPRSRRRFGRHRNASSRLGTRVLDATGLGMLQLDARGRIVAANDRARNILRAGDGLLDGDGVLSARAPRDNDSLQDLLGRALPISRDVKSPPSPGCESKAELTRNHRKTEHSDRKISSE